MISKKAPVKAAAKGKIGNLVSYLLDPKGKADRVAAVVVTNCQSDDSRWAVHEMQAVQNRNQRAKGDKTYHLVISFRDGEDPSPQVLAEIESEFCVALGFTDHQRISVIHRDTDNLHIHVAINKVHPTKFTLHEPFNDYHTRSKLCGQLERRYGLEIDRAKTARDVPANERAATMEAVAGVESLIGYVQRSLKGAVAAAGSWQELHEAFAKAGVALKPRGNGLVVESGGKSAKASSCFRELSKTALEKRFGSFQEKGQRQAAQEATPKKAYRVAPMQRDGGKLYEQYQLARLKAKEAQTGRLSRALDAHRARVARATAAYKTQRTIIGLTRRSTVNTIMLQLHRAHLKGKLAASFATYKAERSTIYRETKLLAWNDWLMNEAAKGSKPALLVLQSRRAKTPPPPRTGRQPPNRMSDPTTTALALLGHPPMLDPITTDQTPPAPATPSDQTTDGELHSPTDSSNEPSLYCSPVLAALEEKVRPDPSPACETCPISMWFTTARELKCFCARMNLIVWDRKSAATPILQCDGRETALLALAMKQARAAAKAAAKAGKSRG